MNSSTGKLILWRDIPTQIVVGRGRKSVKRPLADRFMVAVDKAAMKAGAKTADDYIEDWRSVVVEIGDGEAALDEYVQSLEASWPTSRLAEYVANGGKTPN